MAHLEYSPIADCALRLHDAAAPQRKRDLISDVADWVVTNIPWTVAVPDWQEFHDRWPLRTRGDLAAVKCELRRRAEALDEPEADLGVIAAALDGRRVYVDAATDWLVLNPGRGIIDPEFVRLFSRLSRAELVLTAIEHKQRISRGLAA